MESPHGLDTTCEPLEAAAWLGFAPNKQNAATALMQHSRLRPKPSLRASISPAECEDLALFLLLWLAASEAY